MMRKRTWVLLIAVLCGFGAACGGDDDGNGGTAGQSAAGMSGGGTGGGQAGGGGTGGGGSGTGGGSGELCVYDSNTSINTDCPPIGPLTGSCAQRGECCHRASNAAQEAMLGPDDDMVLEYRVVYSVTTNHPLTIGTPVLNEATTTRYEREQQSTLWRFQSPRMNGEHVSGPGVLTIGQGRYNCDGTYSFYSENAAPSVDGFSTDSARWAPSIMNVMVDADADGAGRMRPDFATSKARELVYTPFLDNTTYELDWELVNQGFDILSIDATEAGRDCIGAREASQWEAGGQFVIYTPVAENNNPGQIIGLIMQRYCQLVAFGVLGEGTRGMSCTETPRCVPDGGMLGDGGCDWVKLPDSLCPTNDAQRALFGCHLGDEDNVNEEPGYPTDLNCTQEAPTSVADPNTGGSAGQCCDPLGQSATLPACNAWRLIQDYVAAAVEITDEYTDEIQQNCSQ
jgi:hypothetical protein